MKHDMFIVLYLSVPVVLLALSLIARRRAVRRREAEYRERQRLLRVKGLGGLFLPGKANVVRPVVRPSPNGGGDA